MLLKGAAQQGDEADEAGGNFGASQLIPGVRRTQAEDGSEQCRRAHPMAGRNDGNTESRVTIHMAASLDGFIARKDGSVDWLETSDEFVGGDTMDPGIRRGVPQDDRLLRHGIANI